MKRKSHWHTIGKGPDRELGKFYQGLAASKPNEHKCSYCPEDFPSKKKLKDHIYLNHYANYYRDRNKDENNS